MMPLYVIAVCAYLSAVQLAVGVGSSDTVETSPEEASLPEAATPPEEAPPPEESALLEEAPELCQSIKKRAVRTEKGAPGPDGINVLCIGDSITHGGHGGEIRDVPLMAVPSSYPIYDVNEEHITYHNHLDGNNVPGRRIKHENQNGKINVMRPDVFPQAGAAYPRKMRDMLRRDGWKMQEERWNALDINVYNYGISGATAQNDDQVQDCWKNGGPGGKKVLQKLEGLREFKNGELPCDVAIVMLGTNDAKTKYWNEERYKEQYTELLKEIKGRCSKVFVGLSPPTQCGHADCRFKEGEGKGFRDKSEVGDDFKGKGGDKQINPYAHCCVRGWGDEATPNIINEDLIRIQKEIANELQLRTIPFREAIGDYDDDGNLLHIKSYMLFDSVHPNELGYHEMAKKAAEVVNEEFAKCWGNEEKTQHSPAVPESSLPPVAAPSPVGPSVNDEITEGSGGDCPKGSVTDEKYGTVCCENLESTMQTRGDGKGAGTKSLCAKSRGGEQWTEDRRRRRFGLAIEEHCKGFCGGGGVGSLFEISDDEHTMAIQQRKHTSSKEAYVGTDGSTEAHEAKDSNNKRKKLVRHSKKLIKRTQKLMRR